MLQATNQPKQKPFVGAWVDAATKRRLAALAVLRDTTESDTLRWLINAAAGEVTKTGQDVAAEGARQG